MISSVMKDFGKVREQVSQVITRNRHVPVFAEIELGLKPSKETIENMVNDSDCYIGIFHQKWGSWIPPKNNPDNLSVTALEYTLAKQKGIPRLILVSELEKEKPLQEFLNKIGEYYEGEWLVGYKDIPDLTGAVGSLIGKLIENISEKSKTITDIEKEIVSYTTKNINQIPDNINGIYEKPNDFDMINQEIQNQNLWIVGERGIGKSVILKKIIENKLKENNKVLFIRSEDLLLKKDFLNVTKDEIGLSITEIISKINQNDESLLLIIDSVDALPRNDEVWSLFSADLLEILEKPLVRVILSIRKSDYLAFPRYFSKDWGKEIILQGLDETQIRRILKNIGLESKVDKELYPILKQPFYLDILATLASNEKFKNTSSLSTQSQFLKAHYDLVVRNSEKWKDLASKRVDLLFQIAEKMFDAKRLKIPNFRFASTPEFNSLRTDGIIIDVEIFIQFFHQIYFDFIMSMKIIENGNISSFLRKIGNETFLRSTIQFTLSYLHDQDIEKYLENIQELLSSVDIDDYWKKVTIGYVANLERIDKKDCEVIESLLNNNSDLQKYFLDSTIEQKNPFWYTIWKDSLFDQWTNSDEFKHERLLTGYIAKSIRWLDHE